MGDSAGDAPRAIPWYAPAAAPVYNMTGQPGWRQFGTTWWGPQGQGLPADSSAAFPGQGSRMQVAPAAQAAGPNPQDPQRFGGLNTFNSPLFPALRALVLGSLPQVTR